MGTGGRPLGAGSAGALWARGRALVITAKYPHPGAVKTRLANRLGFGLATGLYRAFLRDLADAFPAAYWAYTPKDSPFPEFLGAERSYLVQEGENLGERMFNLIRTLLDRGFDKVVLIGSDIPHISLALIDKAFAVLAERDVVLGPAADGGYYLIGLRAAHDLFSGVAWSTPAVLGQTLAKAAQQGLTVGFLPPTFDVDEPEDVDRLLALLGMGGHGVAEYTANKRMGAPLSAYPTLSRLSVDAVPRSLAPDLLVEGYEPGGAGASLPHTSAILLRIRRADAALERSEVGWYYRLTPAQVEKEEQGCLGLIWLEELGQQVRRHMALVAEIAGVLVARLREDLGIPLSDVAVVAARYHDAYRSGDRSHRLRPYGKGPKGLFFPHDGHEARLAFALRQSGARTVARIIRRHNVLRPLCPEVRTIDDNVLLIADAMVEAGQIATTQVRRAAIIARYAAADPQAAQAYHAAYDMVEKTLGLYFDAGLDQSRFQKELGIL